MQLAVIARGSGSPTRLTQATLRKTQGWISLWAEVPDKAVITMVPHLTHGVRHLSLVDSVRQHVRNVRLAGNLSNVDLMRSNCALNPQLFRSEVLYFTTASTQDHSFARTRVRVDGHARARIVMKWTHNRLAKYLSHVANITRDAASISVMFRICARKRCDDHNTRTSRET